MDAAARTSGSAASSYIGLVPQPSLLPASNRLAYSQVGLSAVHERPLGWGLLPQGGEAGPA